MKVILKAATSYINGAKTKADMLLDGAVLSTFSGDYSSLSCPVIENATIFPGFCDVHVHLREPGFSYKETIKSGTLACAGGGYTAVCPMPNLSPTPDSVENINIELDAIRRDACIAVYPYATITKGELGVTLSDMEELAPLCVAFSDDGRGVQSDEMMESAMHKARALGKIIAAHCEDNSLLHSGYIHDGEYARLHGHRGISSESEWRQIERDLGLVEKTGCAYHVCHISTKESVALIRDAKARGLNVTCETGPHYLTLTDMDIEEDGRFKMNPPLRSREDKEALLLGVQDGTIDMIATDHAPHSAEEKSRGLEKSLMGVVGIETAFPVLYTSLVKTGIITVGRLLDLLVYNPRKRFNITADAGFTVFLLDEKYKIDPSEFLSLGKSTPFLGREVYGRCLMTAYDGKVAYLNENILRRK